MTGPDRPPCGSAACSRPASFWRYDGDGDWSPVCDRHARWSHPSLEVHAWLAAGYMRPIERERPQGPPAAPPHERGRTFRAAVDAALGWSD